MSQGNLYPNLSRGYSQSGGVDQGYTSSSSNNLNFYSAPQQHAGYPQNAPYGQQGGPGGPGGNVFNEIVGAGLMSQMGGAALGPMGSTMFNTGKRLVDDNFGRFMTISPLKYYFNVNNSYVMNKIKLLLCPFFHKSWKRRIMRVGEVDSYAFPREDINAPDLYIPTMAFVTYILLVGFVRGTSLQFTPEVLGMTASTGLATLALELLFVKVGFYLCNCGSVSLLDLIAYCGYKFVGIVVNILSGIIFGGYFYFFVAIYIGLAMGFFTIRTLRLVLVLESTRVVVDAPINSTSKNYFLIIVAIFQMIVIYYLGMVA